MFFRGIKLLVLLAILNCANPLPTSERNPPEQNDPSCKNRRFQLYFPGEDSQVERLDEFTKANFKNPEEAGPYFEGDILLSPEDITTLESGLRDERYRWPNATVLYVYDPEFTDEQVRLMKAGMRMISSKTCVKFRAATENDEYYVSINHNHNDICSSRIGRRPLNEQPQPVELADWCFENGGGTGGTVAHELIHALGFYHEHTRSDRDDSIYVVWDNIQQDKKHNFCSNPSSKVNSFNVAYDFGSVMHYSLKSGFAINKDEEVMLLRDGVEYDGEIGQRAKLSDKDIQKVRRMYKCA